MARQDLILIDGELEYILHEEVTEKGLLFELKYSMSQCWSDDIRGTTAMSILDDGNGIKILNKLGQKLEYHHAFGLALLLKKSSGDDLNIEVIKYKDDNC